MKNLLDGIVNFRENDYKTYKGLLTALHPSKTLKLYLYAAVIPELTPTS